MNKTDIDYLTHSWNPIAMRCSEISEGCANCWSLKLCDRMAANPIFSDEVRAAYAGETGPVLVESRLREPLKGKDKVIGVQFMGDLWNDQVPDEFIDQVFGVMSLATQHRFIVLTKRAKRMHDYLTGLRDDPEQAWRFENQGQLMEAPNRFHKAAMTFRRGGSLPNVIGMVSAENQETADERIPWLLKTPFAMRGVSVEPMLEQITLNYLHYQNEVEIDALNGTHGVLRPHGGKGPKLDWVICGGESGKGVARPMKWEWPIHLLSQCEAAGVPFFMKQMSEYGGADKHDIPPFLDIKQFPEIGERNG